MISIGEYYIVESEYDFFHDSTINAFHPEKPLRFPAVFKFSNNATSSKKALLVEVDAKRVASHIEKQIKIFQSRLENLNMAHEILKGAIESD